MAERVITNIKGHVAEVFLNRPEKMNALDPLMFSAITEAGEALKSNPDVSVVILSAEGDHFCAGIDTSTFGDLVARIDQVRHDLVNPAAGEVANSFQKPSHVWQELDVPVIAAVKGTCFGGGAQIALSADFRFAAPDLRFSVMEARWGLIPDMGITQSLPKLLRADQAKDLMMTARIMDAEESLSLGLVTRLAEDPLQAARDYAQELLRRSPEVLTGAKKLVDQTWTAAPGDGLKLEAELQSRIIGFPNQVEAVMSTMQKRPPNYS